MTDYRDIDTDDCENGITESTSYEIVYFDDCDHRVHIYDVPTCNGCGAPLCPVCREYLTVKPGEHRCQTCCKLDEEEYK